jgi:hypothetical protein
MTADASLGSSRVSAYQFLKLSYQTLSGLL